jgi:hypothetical protein
MTSILLANRAEETIQRVPNLITCKAEYVELVKGLRSLASDRSIAVNKAQSELIKNGILGINSAYFLQFTLSCRRLIITVLKRSCRPYCDRRGGYQSVIVDSITELSWEIEERSLFDI